MTAHRSHISDAQGQNRTSPSQYRRQPGKHYASKVLEMAARGGFMGLGLVYGVVGLLALLTVLNGGQQEGPEGAAAWIINQPMGRILVVLCVLGLAAKTLWTVIQAWRIDVPANWSGRATRARLGFNALFYMGIAWLLIGVLIGGADDPSGDSEAQDWTAELMYLPFGRWLVGLVGLGLIFFGFLRVRLAIRGDFLNVVEHENLSPLPYRAISWTGRFGLCAMAAVSMLIGTLLIFAAWNFDPDQARGLGGVLSRVAEQPFGAILLGVLSIGLMLYGIYQILLGCFRPLDRSATETQR